MCVWWYGDRIKINKKLNKCIFHLTLESSYNQHQTRDKNTQ